LYLGFPLTFDFGVGEKFENVGRKILRVIWIGPKENLASSPALTDDAGLLDVSSNIDTCGKDITGLNGLPNLGVRIDSVQKAG